MSAAILAGVLSILTLSAFGPSAAGADTDYSKRVSELAKKLADPSAEVRQDGEIGLELLPPEAFPAMDAAADDSSLDPAARQKLRTIVERVRPWQKARLRRAGLRKQEFEWLEKAAMEAYDRVAKHDARWDEPAREGIRRFTRTPEGEHVSARGPLEKAVAAGCDDPLILYLTAASMMTGGQPSDEEYKLYERAQRPLMAGEYPAYFKVRMAIDAFRIAYRYLSIQVNKENRQTFNHREQQVQQRWADQQLQFWPRFVKDNPPNILLFETANDILDRHRILGADLKRIHDRLAPYLQKAMPNSPYLFAFDGECYINWAWQARGDGTANTVTEEGWKQFHERLAMARDSLQKAYDLDPNEPDAPTQMLTVELGEGKDRESMETWYKRAMAADPDNLTACEIKMDYLQPKWNGSEEEMLQFGRDCYATGNWAGKLPLMLVEARVEQSEYYPNADAFFAQPEVWADFQHVYEPYLRANPNDWEVRSDYAYYACRAGHWDVARQQFKVLGKNVKLDWNLFLSPAVVKEFRQKAEHDGHVPDKPATNP